MHASHLQALVFFLHLKSVSSSSTLGEDYDLPPEQKFFLWPSPCSPISYAVL